MNREAEIAERIAVKFDTKKEIDEYKRTHDSLPSTKLEVRTPAEMKDRYKERARHGAMRLNPLNPQPEGSVASKAWVKCCVCSKMVDWNVAADNGWTADANGRPYHDYYCAPCAQVAIRRERTAGDANMEYDKRMRTLRQSLRVLDKQLEKHEMLQKQNPNDWGYAGDLGHAAELLNELMRFLGV